VIFNAGAFKTFFSQDWNNKSSVELARDYKITKEVKKDSQKTDEENNSAIHMFLRDNNGKKELILRIRQQVQTSSGAYDEHFKDFVLVEAEKNLEKKPETKQAAAEAKDCPECEAKKRQAQSIFEQIKLQIEQIKDVATAAAKKAVQPVAPPTTLKSKSVDGKEHLWVRDTSNSKLGEAWRDEKDLVWGDIIKKSDGTIFKMNHADATNYCTSIGARLPTRDEFVRLRDLMGATSRAGFSDARVSGYSPQILPNLDNLDKNWFWSASSPPGYRDDFYNFGGSEGDIFISGKELRYAVRCVDSKEEQIKREADATGVIWDDIAKDKNGKVLYMNHPDAVKYCEKDGKRLPTVREQALLSQSMGSKGLKETTFADIKTSDAKVSAEITQMNKDGYYAFYKKNQAGETVVDFYFNYNGYKKPTGDLGENYFWSSSVHPVYSSYAYELFGCGGYIYYGYDYGAVRCVRSR
jgi:hypothetical protein